MEKFKIKTIWRVYLGIILPGLAFSWWFLSHEIGVFGFEDEKNIMHGMLNIVTSIYWIYAFLRIPRLKVVFDHDKVSQKTIYDEQTSSNSDVAGFVYAKSSWDPAIKRNKWDQSWISLESGFYCLVDSENKWLLYFDRSLNDNTIFRNSLESRFKNLGEIDYTSYIKGRSLKAQVKHPLLMKFLGIAW